MNLKPTDLAAARAVLADLQALRACGADLAAYETPLAAALKVIDTTFPFFERMWTRNNVIAALNVVRDPAHHARGEADYWIGRAVASVGQYLPPQPEARPIHPAWVTLLPINGRRGEWGPVEPAIEIERTNSDV